MLALGAAAKRAARAMREASTETKNKALLAAAAAIRAGKADILAANAKDIAAGKSSGLTSALLDRLTLDDKRIEAMAKGVEDVAALPDPVGRELARWTVPSGLDIARVATPIGVIGMIYESRPNVTADAGALCLKSGNVCILRGGSDSAQSSAAIHAAMLEGLHAAGLPEATITRVPTTDREAVGLMLEGLGGRHRPHHPARRQRAHQPRDGGGAGAGARASRRRLPRLYPCQSRSSGSAGHRGERQDAADLGLRSGGNAAARPRDPGHAGRRGAPRSRQGRLRNPRGRRNSHRISRRQSRQRRRLVDGISRCGDRREGRRWRRGRHRPYRALRLASHRKHRHRGQGGGGAVPFRARLGHRAVERLDAIRRRRGVRHGGGDRYRHRQAACAGDPSGSSSSPLSNMSCAERGRSGREDQAPTSARQLGTAAGTGGAGAAHRPARRLVQSGA